VKRKCHDEGYSGENIGFPHTKGLHEGGGTYEIPEDRWRSSMGKVFVGTRMDEV
jgi:hypothetical protein